MCQGLVYIKKIWGVTFFPPYIKFILEFRGYLVTGRVVDTSPSSLAPSLKYTTLDCVCTARPLP